MMSRKTAMSVCALAAMAIGGLTAPAHALTRAEPISVRQASQEVTTADVLVHDGVVSGTVVNRSGATLRDVKVMIDHAWLWNNERHPGPNDPSRTDFYTLPQAIPPYGTQLFEYHMRAPGPHRTDGRFATMVKVISFTEVGTQQASR
jgi:hypothetical protein